MAGIVADYVVIQGTDNPINLSGKGDIDDTREFDIPSKALVGPQIDEPHRGQNPILSLMVNHSVEKPNDLKAEIRINGNKVFGYGPTDTNLSRSFHEVLQYADLKKGKNTFEVKIVGGTGTFSVSDVIVWFQSQM